MIFVFLVVDLIIDLKIYLKNYFKLKKINKLRNFLLQGEIMDSSWSINLGFILKKIIIIMYVYTYYYH